MFNFWWSARLVDGLECHPPPLSSQRMKCSFLDYIQLLMISWAGQWTRIPSATPLQTKKWYAHFCITFNFWWLARLVNGLEPHLQPLSNQKYEMLVFGLHSTSDDQPGSKDLNPICNLFPTNKMKCYFCIMFNFWWLARLVDGLKPHPPPLSSQKNEMLIFRLLSIPGDQPGWSMDSNPIHHPSPAKEWNAHFWIMFNFWWLARLVKGLKFHLQPLSNQKYEMLVFGLRSTSDDRQAGQRTQTPSATSFQPTKWNARFGIMFNFCWSARLVDGLKPHLSPLSNQKNEMLVFALCSTSDDQPGWSMDSNPICHPSQAKKMKCSFLYYIQLLMIGRAGHWTQTPSTCPLKPKKNEMLIFGLHLTSDDQPGWSMDLNPICHLSPGIKWNSHFCITFNLWWSARLVMDSNPICHPSPAKKMKC